MTILKIPITFAISFLAALTIWAHAEARAADEILLRLEQHDPFGGAILTLFNNGTATRESWGCTGSVTDSGRFVLGEDSLTVFLSLSLQPPRIDTLSAYIIHWNNATFLVEPYRMVVFCNDVNGGGLHSWDFYYHTECNTKLDLAGIPQVPPAWRGFIFVAPVIARVVSVDPVAWRISIDAGLSDGVYRDCEFNLRTTTWAVWCVTESTDSSSVLEIPDFRKHFLTPLDRLIGMPERHGEDSVHLAWLLPALDGLKSLLLSLKPGDEVSTRIWDLPPEEK